jgi:hypothetical protein
VSFFRLVNLPFLHKPEESLKYFKQVTRESAPLLSPQNLRFWGEGKDSGREPLRLIPARRGKNTVILNVVDSSLPSTTFRIPSPDSGVAQAKVIALCKNEFAA